MISESQIAARRKVQSYKKGKKGQKEKEEEVEETVSQTARLFSRFPASPSSRRGRTGVKSFAKPVTTKPGLRGKNFGLSFSKNALLEDKIIHFKRRNGPYTLHNTLSSCSSNINLKRYICLKESFTFSYLISSSGDIHSIY